MTKGYTGSAMAPHNSKSNSASFTAAKRRSTCTSSKPEIGRKTMGCSKAVGRSHKKSSHEKREKKKMKKLRAEVKDMEAFVSVRRTQMEGERRFLLEAEAKLEEFKALVAQKKEENELHFRMILCVELLADHIQFNILP